ncbi:MAG: hypothetical protein J1E41_00935 [Ruminococcus sp.]|nr:hypothetical protein [Ruminococcus sp.]
MLSFNFTDISGHILSLTNPIYIVINQDENIPADDLSVTFPFIRNAPELCSVEVTDGNSVVFKGIVDEQQNISTEKNAYTKIVVRSMAAMLLDNESKPVSYTNPSTSVIFNRHLYPNLISEYRGEELVLNDSFNISKGMTDWQAFSSFCIKAFGRVPRIDADGTANFSGVTSDKNIKFSNIDGIKYNSIKENKKRCKLISEVYVKTSQSDIYDTVIVNKDVKNRMVERKRYLDASVSDSLTLADTMLRNAALSSVEVTVETPIRLLNVLGAGVSIEDNNLGTISGLKVSSIYYSQTPQGEKTILMLKKENENVDS